jgi:hypothetical protein
MTRTPTASTGHRSRPGSRREDIAAAAIELFLDRGVTATRVEDILAGGCAARERRRDPWPSVHHPRQLFVIFLDCFGGRCDPFARDGTVIGLGDA